MDHNPCGPDLPLPQFPEEPTPPSSPQEVVKLSIRDMTAFMEALKTDYNFPLTIGFFKPWPIYCREHIEEPQEPFHSHWRAAESLLLAVDRGDEEDDYGEWVPNENYRKLEQLVADLRTVAFRMRPNPEYDHDRCETWKQENRRGPINQNKIEWGMRQFTKELAKDLEENLIKGE